MAGVDVLMHDVILKPLLAGLSAGLFCCVSCYPFLAPVFAAENRSARATAWVWGQFLAGRLTGYLLFGAVVGGLGARFHAIWFDWISLAGLVIMSVLLIFYAVGFWRPAWSFCAAGTKRGRATPAVLGFLMGINVCPPFLLSLAYVFTLHSMFKGIVYFLVFFVATSLYFLPLFFVGLLGRMREFRWAARASALVVGVLFLLYGVSMMHRIGWSMP